MRNTKVYFGRDRAFEVRSDAAAGIVDSGTEFSVSMSHALPAAYVFVRLDHSQNRIERTLEITQRSEDQERRQLNHLEIITDENSTEHIYLSGKRLEDEEVGRQFIEPVTNATVPSSRDDSKGN